MSIMACWENKSPYSKACTQAPFAGGYVGEVKDLAWTEDGLLMDDGWMVGWMDGWLDVWVDG